VSENDKNGVVYVVLRVAEVSGILDALRMAASTVNSPCILRGPWLDALIQNVAKAREIQLAMVQSDYDSLNAPQGATPDPDPLEPADV
jgi:hypothetical protein